MYLSKAIITSSMIYIYLLIIYILYYSSCALHYCHSYYLTLHPVVELIFQCSQTLGWVMFGGCRGIAGMWVELKCNESDLCGNNTSLSRYPVSKIQTTTMACEVQPVADFWERGREEPCCRPHCSGLSKGEGNVQVIFSISYLNKTYVTQTRR